MADTFDQRYEIKTERPLDPCFVETVRLAEDKNKMHIVRSSRLIVLSQNDPDATLENTVVAAEGEHLLVYGDRVRVAGRIQLRGLSLSINCRDLEFSPGSTGNPEIDVSGEDGWVQGLDKKTILASINVWPPPQAEKGTEHIRAGKPGALGQGGNDGENGRMGGTIYIACHTFHQFAPVTLKADGGKGHDGIRGQDGGLGGNGLDDAPNDWNEESGSEGAKGGLGGNGGNGGNGGQGGNGGKIEFYCHDLRPSNFPVTLSVVGGDGGKGGNAGNGGNGGTGGRPREGATDIDLKHFLDGADSGGGGAAAFPGFGGGCGNPGTLTVRSAAPEVLSYPAKKFLQEQTASLILRCKSGTVGKDGNTAKPGEPGEPGKPAIEKAPTGFGPGALIVVSPKSGRAGNKGTPALPPAAPKAPARQTPVQRKWEVWEGVAQPPKRPPEPPRPKPLEQRLPPGLEALAKRDPKAAQQRMELITRQWKAEMDQWNEAVRKYNREHPLIVPIKVEVVLKECWNPVAFKEICIGQDGEQLQMLHDYVRTRYLLAPNGRALSVPHLREQVAWLVDVSHAKLDRKKEDEKEIVLNTPVAMYRLWQAASSTYGNLWNGNNVFGHDGNYALLGDLGKHVKALQKMRENLKDIESLYDQTVRFHNMATSWKTTWSQVKSDANGIVATMDENKNEIKKRLESALSAIKEKEIPIQTLRGKLEEQVKQFKVEINNKIGLTPLDFFGMLSQLSFTNRDVVHPEHADLAGNIVPEKFLLGGGLATGAMLLSQAGELATKAIENVVTDDGQPISKKYIIRNVKALTEKLPTLENFKQERDGLISQDPNAAVRLLATREQFNSILENFYEQSTNARNISYTLDAYVEAVQNRNAKIDEWNQLLALYAYCVAESKRAELQSSAVDKATSNDPGVVAMAGFSTTLNRHALQDYIKRLYEAGRVCTLHTLREFDAFGSLFDAASESVADIGFLNSKILAKVVNDFIGASLDSTQTLSDRSGMESIEFELRAEKETDQLIFELLRKGQPAPFIVPPPGVRAILPDAKPPADPEEPAPERNVFALKADVRLTHIVPSLFLSDGKPLSSLCSRYTVELTHSGIETFCRPDGKQIRLNHFPMTKEFNYDDRAAVADSGELDAKEHAKLVGPFCEWEIRIPEGGLVYKKEVKAEDQNLSKLQSIRITFKGTYRAFEPSAVDEAKEDAKAVPVEVNDENFKHLVVNSNKPVVVDFRPNEDVASPALEPVRKQVKSSFTGKVRFATLNVADTDSTKKTYELYKGRVPKLPSLAVFSGGDILQVLDGLPTDQVTPTLSKFLGQPSAGG